MKLSKKKVTSLALVVCLIAILSMSTLAWFTDSDSVKNDFFFADSETSDPDNIFSVDVWEDLDGDGDADTTDGHQYKDVLPGDVLDKIVHVENTGDYDQYIRVTVTISDAHVWQDIYNTTGIVPLTTMVNGLKVEDLYAMRSYVDTASNSFVYVLYYEDVLKHEDGADEIVVFTSVNIPTMMEVQDAANMGALFNISVKAEAVQTRNVGDNVVDAFDTVFDDVIVDTVWANSLNELQEAFTYKGIQQVALTEAQTISEAVELKSTNAVTVVANGIQDAFTVASGGELTLGQKVTVRSNNAILYANGGTIIIDGAELACSGVDTLGYAENGGTIRVDSGAVTALQNVLSAKGGKIEINGGTVKGLTEAAAVHVRNGSTLTITNGTIEGAVGVRSGSVGTFNGGTIYGNLTVYDGGNASATVDGGSCIGWVYTSGSNATLTVISGRFTTEVASEYLAAGSTQRFTNAGPGNAWYIVEN